MTPLQAELLRMVERQRKLVRIQIWQNAAMIFLLVMVGFLMWQLQIAWSNERYLDQMLNHYTTETKK